MSKLQSKDYTGKAPLYQQWSDKEFMYDTRHMNWLAREMYRCLLQSAWHLSTRPDLPDDDNQLQNIIGCPKDVWDEHRDAVRAMLIGETVNGVNVLWQKRLRADWQTIEDYRTTQSDLANRRWNKNKKLNGNAKADAKGHADVDAKADAKAMPAKQRKEKKSKEKKRKAEKREVSFAAADASGNVGIQNPIPSHLSALPAGLSTEKDGGQENITLIQAKVFQLVGKTPKAEHVEALLRSYRPLVILEAFKDYVKNLSDDDKAWAEKVFFADGGAAGVILSIRQKNWLESVQYLGESAEQESVDEWLADNPPPVGISNWTAECSITEAKKNRAKVDDEYYAKNSTTAAESVTGEKSS